MNILRRRFLSQVGALSAASSFTSLAAIDAFAQVSPANDYKALVCVFLYGGNDGNNMIVPIEASEYASYASVRGAQADGGVSLPVADLLALAPPAGSARFGLHPALTDLQTLWNQNALAVLFNTGTLVAPIGKAQYQSGPRPLSLFSHSDQQAQWQASIADAPSRTGWGGRIADGLGTMNTGATIPSLISVAGNSLFATGNSTFPLSVPASGNFGLAGFNASAPSQARLAALKQILGAGDSGKIANSTSNAFQLAIDHSNIIGPVLKNSTASVQPLFSALATPIAQQLLQVAKIIEARATFGLKRQIFFVSLGGFDTHSGQIATQANLLAQLGPALKAFYDATVQLGVANQVTSFTLSDFGRTLKPASGGGSDHAWGNHHLIIGGAVKGRNVYGTFPTLALAGPDDISKEGRWLPTVAVDQYAATLANWFGLSPADIALALPNLNRFATADVGFMNIA